MNYLTKKAYIYYHKCFLKFMIESVSSLKDKNNTTLVFLLSKRPQVLTIFYDSPAKYYIN